MSLVRIVGDFVADAGDDVASKAVFEAAMEKRIQGEGYKVADLMFEVFRCQADLVRLGAQVDQLVKEKPCKPKSAPKKKP